MSTTTGLNYLTTALQRAVLATAIKQVDPHKRVLAQTLLDQLVPFDVHPLEADELKKLATVFPTLTVNELFAGLNRCRKFRRAQNLPGVTIIPAAPSPLRE